MPQASLTQPPKQSSNQRIVGWLILSLLSFLSFVFLVLPGDLLLFHFSGFLASISQALSPLAYGPEIYFSPLGFLVAVGVIIRNSSRSYQRHGLGMIVLFISWMTVALYLLSLSLYLLSILGILRPFI